MCIAVHPAGLAMERFIVSGNDKGFTYLALLFYVSIMGIGLAAAGTLWSTAHQREKEVELLFIGNAFRQAIVSYYERTPGTVKRYPDSFSDLLHDKRQLYMARHLRCVYLDPLTLHADWGIIRAPDGGIMGVYSRSPDTALKRSHFLSRDAVFEKTEKYSSWRFVYKPIEPRI